MAKDRKPYHIQVAEECIEALKNGTAPWIMPWEPGNMPEPPVNAVSGRPYRGINRLMLSMQQGNHIDPRWCTYKQAQELGAQVRKGEKGTTIQYWKLREERLLKDEQGRPLLNEEGQKRYSVAEFERPRVFYATVFHASQIENMPALPERSTEAKPAWERHQQAERLLAASGATIFNDQVSRAFYQVTRDEIHLPSQNQFTSPDKYYATALHELGHWSGHEKRLDRDIRHPFGSEGYAREELRAELASYILGGDLGIGHDPDQHHAYIATWIKVLQEDPREIIRAAQDAERIREYVMGLERQQGLTNETGNTLESEGAAGLQHEKTQRPGSEDGRSGEAAVLAGEKTWLNVPYKEKDAAKKAGARWDRQEKRWYAPEGTDLQPLQKWQAVPAQSMSQTPAVLEPSREFGQVLRDAGLVIEGDPILDGKIHRVPVVGGRRGAKDGAYSGHEDGRPNGWYQNHKTGVQGKWVSTGHTLTTEARNALRQETAENLVAAATDRQATQEKAQKRAYAKWMNAELANPDHPYLTKKGIAAFNLRQDKHGNLIVPGYDERGRLQTMEYINKEGGKWYEKGCPKKGAVCVLPDKDALKEADVVLMVEGYATGVSVHQATGLPVAVAFDAGNIKDAAMAIKRKMPNARITICADNDPPRPDGTNIGVMKAKEAAASIPGTKVVVADFSQDEKSRGLTDFNDLHQARGLAAIRKAIFAESEKDKQAEEVER